MSVEFVCPDCRAVIVKHEAERQVHCLGCGGTIVVSQPHLPPLPSSVRHTTRQSGLAPASMPVLNGEAQPDTPPAPFQWDRHSLLIVNGMMLTLVVMVGFCGTVIGHHLPSTARAGPLDSPPSSVNVGPIPAMQTSSQENAPAVLTITTPQWVAFVDAGGRFRCLVPPGVTPRQIESATRSKVGFDTEDRKLGVIVRDTTLLKIDQSVLDSLVTTFKRDSAKMGTLTVERQTLIQLRGATAAEIVSTIKRGSTKAYARQIKFVQHGQDHVITTVTTGGNTDEVNRIFDEFVENYQSIDPNQEPAAGKEKALPAELDFTLPQ